MAESCPECSSNRTRLVFFRERVRVTAWVYPFSIRVPRRCESCGIAWTPKAPKAMSLSVACLGIVLTCGAFLSFALPAIESILAMERVIRSVVNIVFATISIPFFLNITRSGWLDFLSKSQYRILSRVT